jgi:predicted transcriptional regulator
MTIAFSIFVSACASQLGSFEQRGLHTLWSNGSAALRELLADGKIRQAYTTMMTTMHRLYKKGLLDRIAEAERFAILRASPPEELQRVDSAGEHPSGSCWPRVTVPYRSFISG